MRLSSHLVTCWQIKLELYQKNVKWLTSIQLLTSTEYITKIWECKITDSDVQYSYIICTDLKKWKILKLSYLTVLIVISAFTYNASLMYIFNYLSYLFTKNELNMHTWMQEVNENKNYLKIRSMLSAAVIILF